jgi:GNAT superfamily N-acetyltransferase
LTTVEAVVVTRADIDSPVVQELFEELNAGLTALYPEAGANHFSLSADEVAQGRGAVFIAEIGGDIAGCAAVRMLDGHTAEFKRMYVRAAFRKRGVAAALMQSVEREARGLGATRAVLETGARQPAAVALAERFGFKRIAPFGEYLGSPLSVCLGKKL